jgi:hypothetical protein
MRRESRAGGWKTGGAREWVAMARVTEFKSRDVLIVGCTATTVCENDTPCIAEVTKGECIAGMALQQSCP